MADRRPPRKPRGRAGRFLVPVGSTTPCVFFFTEGHRRDPICGLILRTSVDGVRKARQEVLKAPDWLSPDAVAIYRRVAAMRPDADPDLIAVYASSLAEHNRAQEMLNRTGPVVQGAKGPVRNPLSSVKQANAGTVRQLAKALGLSGGPDVPPQRPKRYRNQKATEATIVALRQLGRIEPVDESAVALARTLAASIDSLEVDDPAVGALARTQLQALRMLRGQQDDSANALAALLASVSGAMGDAPES